MFNSAGLKWSVAALLVAMQLCGGMAGAVTMETVPVGNPNLDDDTGYGGVTYEYNIGQYEVTAGQYREFLNAVAASDPYGLYSANMDSNQYGCQITQHNASGSYTYDFSGKPSGTTDADWANRPVNWVSWGDAARFANWLHNGQPTGTLTGTPALDAGLTEDGSYYLNGANDNSELMAITRESDATWVIPTEDEWYKAAYYDTVSAYFDYPTSSNTAPGYVNNAGKLSNDTGTAFSKGGTDPGNYATHDNDGSPYGIGSPYYSTEVGEWENSGSRYGTFDQGGNLFEWNEAVIGSSRGVRGGYWGVGSDYLAAARGYNDPSGEVSHIGFRVASSVAIPEPGSITLLVCGLLGCLVCCRRRR